MNEDRKTAFSGEQRRLGQRYALLANLFMQATLFIVAGGMMMLFANDVLGFSPRRWRPFWPFRRCWRFSVFPCSRRRGFGHRILALTLEKARERGLERILITCDRDNLASRKIIEKQGGHYIDEVISDLSGKPVIRFWITQG